MVKHTQTMTVRFPAALAQWATEEAETKGTTTAEIVRRAVQLLRDDRVDETRLAILEARLTREIEQRLRDLEVRLNQSFEKASTETIQRFLERVRSGNTTGGSQR